MENTAERELTIEEQTGHALGPLEIIEALEAWEEVAELLPDDDPQPVEIIYALGANA